MRRITKPALFIGCLVLLSGCPTGGTGPFFVLYLPNDATSGTVPVDSQAYSSGDEVTVLANTGELARDGYQFAGWNTDADGSGTRYQAEDTLLMGSSSISLYAEWEGDAVSVTGVSLGESSLTLEATDTYQLTATILPPDASNQSVDWSTDSATVATVSDSGLVTAEGVGTATISVTTDDGGFSATVDVTVCDPLSTLNAGDLVISEIMCDPLLVADGDGEWFEVYVAASVPVNLNGLVISDLGTDSFTVSSDLAAVPGDYLVFASNAEVATNGGVTVDYEYGSAMALTNASDEIILTGTGVLDQVTYDTVVDNWATIDTPGRSFSLGSAQLDATDNDDSNNWMAAVETYGIGDYGTPGAANPSLP